MAKKKTTTQATQAPQDPYAVALGLIQEAKEDKDKIAKAATQLASLMTHATNDERRVLHESCAALLKMEYDKAEFHLTHLMRSK
tara:strand:- start:168 stop:419 length:252 start_codon:yes stop_codon:yes gene_type:complete